MQNTQTYVSSSVELIKDPLWKHVCTEMIALMGPHYALKIGESKLGPLSPHYKNVELYCPTQEIAKFAEQYAFVILGSLQRYFPAIKELRVNISVPTQ
jgi:hypothetical protein